MIKGFKGIIQKKECIVVPFSTMSDRTERNRLYDLINKYELEHDKSNISVYCLRHSENDDFKPLTLETSVLINKWGILFIDKSLGKIRWGKEDGCLQLNSKNFSYDTEDVVDIEALITLDKK